MCVCNDSCSSEAQELLKLPFSRNLEVCVVQRAQTTCEAASLLSAVIGSAEAGGTPQCSVSSVVVSVPPQGLLVSRECVTLFNRIHRNPAKGCFPSDIRHPVEEKDLCRVKL